MTINADAWGIRRRTEEEIVELMEWVISGDIELIPVVGQTLEYEPINIRGELWMLKALSSRAKAMFNQTPVGPIVSRYGMRQF